MNDRKFSIDYYAVLSVSDDKLSAHLLMKNIDDSFSCTTDELEDYLRNSSIVHGVQRGRLVEIARNPSAFMNSSVQVAIGTPPKNGTDGSIEYKYDLDMDLRKPLVLEDGSVDYKEMTTIYNVRKGEQIARRILPTEDTPGKAVTGEALFGKKGKEVRLKLGKNVMTDPEQIFLFASTDGMISRTDGDKINVFPIYEVNGDVDYNIGNIDFIGTVVIRGSVLTGFRIKASGDIRVTGGVEGAELLADGSIEISGGVLGQNKGLIKASRNVKLGFAQEANIEAGEDILVTQSIMHSTIRAGKSVLCRGTKGLIVGGVVQAGESVSARTVGNSLSTSTTIEVGVLPEHRNELMNLRLKLRGLIENHKKTEQALSLLDQLAASGQLTGDKMAMRIRLNNTKKMSLAEIDDAKDRVLELETMLENVDKAKIEVAATIYGGAKLVMGRYTKFIKDPAVRVHFRIVDGDIVMMANSR
ncbi:DUF342 domain-containing protein [Gorillibacterium massiliense]|uniref:DUF342 domain-containing protein n=1 Tax=Gorillibacterium massiliense TaxID=1280390 RepID=UPI0004B35AAE|nr:FapA family protein [Gorillibacterium massiliense]